MIKRVTISLIVLSFTTLTNCTGELSKEEDQIQIIPLSNYELLQGNWVSIGELDAHENPMLFTFWNNTCSYIYPFGQYSTFEMIGDTLRILERGRIRQGDTLGGKLLYDFLLTNLNENRAILTPINRESRDLLFHTDYADSTTITLQRIEKKNNIIPNVVSFGSTGCFGFCPSQVIEVDTNLNVKFVGGMYANPEGSYSGTIDQGVYDRLLSLVNHLPVDSIQEHYSAGWTDDQTCGLYMVYGNDTLHTSAYGFDKEPIELRLLFHFMMELPQLAQLQPDTIDKYDIRGYARFAKYFWGKIPSPPALPPPIIKE